MGELLRRYWMPIAAVAELDDHPTKPVRLLGEGRASLGVSWAAAGAARADLGALHLGQRLRADRVLRGPLQLVPMPGKLDRSGALRVAPLELVARTERRRRPLADAPEGGVRG